MLQEPICATSEGEIGIWVHGVEISPKKKKHPTAKPVEMQESKNDLSC